MVPLHDDPVSMTIVNDTYPKAGPDGSYSYEKTVSFKALEAAFAKKFPRQRLDLARRRFHQKRKSAAAQSSSRVRRGARLRLARARNG
jgi:hypothetical protein